MEAAVPMAANQDDTHPGRHGSQSLHTPQTRARLNHKLHAQTPPTNMGIPVSNSGLLEASKIDMR